MLRLSKAGVFCLLCALVGCYRCYPLKVMARDAASGEPVAGATARAGISNQAELFNLFHPHWRSATTDRQGVAMLTFPETSEPVAVSVTAAGYSPWFIDLRVGNAVATFKTSGKPACVVANVQPAGR